jgi:hypothetical protein
MKNKNIIRKISKYYKKMKENPYNNIYRDKLEYYVEELCRKNIQKNSSNFVPNYMKNILLM